MAWTETTRRQYRREGLRYASDTTDGEWATVEALLPPARRLGRPRTSDLRVIVNAILYVLATGCQWRALPTDFPPRSTVQGYFYRWRDDGTWRWLNARLVSRARQMLGRNVAPSAAIIDSQSAPTTESGGPRGVDAGKRIKGRKRHIVTDTQGFLLAGQVHEANIQDPHGAVPLLRALRRSFPSLCHIFADRICRGFRTCSAAIDGQCAHGRSECRGLLAAFPPRRGRWVVERTRPARPDADARQGLRGHHCLQSASCFFFRPCPHARRLARASMPPWIFLIRTRMR